MHARAFTRRQLFFARGEGPLTNNICYIYKIITPLPVAKNVPPTASGQGVRESNSNSVLAFLNLYASHCSRRGPRFNLSSQQGFEQNIKI